ncbi:hypothetical protein [Clostridium sp. JNZ J1-5]
MKVRLELYKKTTTGGYDDTPKVLKNDEIMSASIDRRIFEVGTCSCLIDNTSRDKKLTDIVNQTGLGYFDTHNMIKLYINAQVAFTGIIKEYKYDEDNNTYYFRAEDMIYKIFRTIDSTPYPYISFTNRSAKQIIQSLFEHAGINTVNFSTEIIDYAVNKVKIEYNTMYVDVLEKFFNTMYARFHCNRDGSVSIVKAFPAYDGTPTVEYKLESIDYISSGEYDRNENDIRNKVVVKASDTDVQAFECPYLVKHTNDEIYLDTIDEDLANTLDKKRNVALKYFRDKLRHSKRFSVTTVNGSLDREIGDIARIVLNQSDVKGWAMVNGISTSIQDGKWQDTLELELLVADSWVMPVAVSGDYIIKN